MIVFDEHIVHGSAGGGERLQWRVDFVVDPLDDAEAAKVRDWYAQSIPDERDDPGYDAGRYPSFGRSWRLRHRSWAARLSALGVLAAPSS